MYICIYVYMYICIYVYYVYMYICIYVYMYMYVYIYTIHHVMFFETFCRFPKMEVPQIIQSSWMTIVVLKPMVT